MSESPTFKAVRTAGPPDGKPADNAPVNVDALLQSILGRGAEYFGMVAAVLQGEHIIAQGAAGVRKRGAAERLTFDDRFHLGSCTKAMTATLIAMLVEEGTLNWTTTLGELFADTMKSMHPAWEKVTLRQVLAHRAGLRLDPDGPGRMLNHVFLASNARLPTQALLGPSEKTLPQQRLEIVRRALARPPKNSPGTRFSYSNEGYILAGTVLERLTGRTWEDLMRERLFQPLGITTGGFGAPGTAGKIDQPWGHSPFMGKPLDPGSPDAEVPLYYGPAGLAHMTVADWAKFIALHLRGNPANPHRRTMLLTQDTFAELHPVIPDATYFKGWVMRGLTWLLTGDAAPDVIYRAGWFISTASWAKGTRPGDTGRRLWHAGSNGRWHCAVSIAPEIDLAVLVASNRGPDLAILKTREAARELIRAYAPQRIS